jgi:acyl carrier protein
MPQQETRERETSAKILTFIRGRFLDGDQKGELDERSPLLEWGVLTSMNMVELLAFIRLEFGVDVPPTRMTGRDFRDVSSITAMVTELAPASQRRLTEVE